MFETFQKIYKALEENGVENPLEETLRLYDILSTRAISRLDKHILRELPAGLSKFAIDRKKGVPTEYIIGKAPFMGQLFECSPEALIPREETELLTAAAIETIHSRWSGQDQVLVIDMGTGCGNIAISIALNVSTARVMASDLDEGHVRIARKNVEKFNLQDRVFLFPGDLFAPLDNRGYDRCIDLIVCNPPYIPTSSLQKLTHEIKSFEPATAFDGGPYGINIYRRLIQDAPRFLKSGGILIFEIGAGQEKIVTRLLKAGERYSEVDYFDDGKQIRVVRAVYRSG